MRTKELKGHIDRDVVKGTLESLNHKFKGYQFSLREESIPSASIRRDGLIKDFGGDFTGDIFDLLQTYHDMDFKESKSYVLNYMGLSSESIKVTSSFVIQAPIKREVPMYPSYDISSIYRQCSQGKHEAIQRMGKDKMMKKMHTGLLPASIISQLDKNTLKRMIGFDTRNDSFTVSLLDGDDVKAITVQRVGEIKWKTFGKKSYTPYRIDHNPYAFVVFGMKEILLLEASGWPYIGFQSDSTAKSISRYERAEDIKRAVMEKVLILLLDNDDSCHGTIEPIEAFFDSSYIVKVDFQKLLFDKQLPKGYDFYDFVIWCGSLDITEWMIDDYIGLVPPYDIDFASQKVVA